jgi:mannose-6-phosphate isomerase-like protein (cupin superfamily)
MSRHHWASVVVTSVALGAAAQSGADTKQQPTSEPYVANIAAKVRENDAFRRVLYTGVRTQLVAMQLPAGTDIGKETHANVEQVFVIVSGNGRAEINGVARPLSAGDLVVAPKGATHDIINTGQDPLELYTIYAPPNHLPGRVHATKEDAAKDDEDEAFGKTVR